MQMTLRWYGSKYDTVTLKQIRQIPGVTGVISTLYGAAPGEAWKLEDILSLKKEIEDAGLQLAGIESVNVHDAIKVGTPDREKYIENYITTLEHLGQAGIHLVCYNFMPVFDWLRTELRHKNSDGSTCLCYGHEELMKLDIDNLHLPGWDESYSPGQLSRLLEEYSSVSHDMLFENLIYFLECIMPACKKAGINMAIHPDDPPWDMFGLPRIITGEQSYDRLFSAIADSHNGITFCTGSLGAGRENDLTNMAKKYSDRIFFAHIRQLKYGKGLDFAEAGHLTKNGDLDIAGIVKALVETGFDGYVRPDHGRNIWDEDGKPGYGLYDRALGATYLNGLFEAFEREKCGK